MYCKYAPRAIELDGRVRLLERTLYEPEGWVSVVAVVMAEVRTSEGKHELLSTKATRVSLIGPPQNKGMWVKKYSKG